MMGIKESYRYFLVRFILASCFFVLILMTLILDYSKMSVFSLYVLNLFLGVVALGKRSSLHFKNGKIGFSLVALIALGSSFIYTALEDFSSNHFLHPIQNVYLYTSFFILLCMFREFMLYRLRLPNKKIQTISDVLPKSARVLKEDRILNVFAKEVKVGDIVIVKSLETIPCDGVVLAGETSVDEKVISGSEFWVDKKIGDSVYAGTINQDSEIKIKVSTTLKFSVISKVLSSISEIHNIAKDEKLYLDELAGYLLGSYLLVGIVIYLIAMYVYGISSWLKVLNVFLVLFTLGVSNGIIFAEIVPLVVVKKMAATKGIIIRNIHALYSLFLSHTFVFNKRGTLTTGSIEIAKTTVFSKGFEKDFFAITRALGNKCGKTFKQLFLDIASQENGKFLNCKVKRFVKGKGLIGTFKKDEIMLGSLSFLKDNAIKIQTEVLELPEHIVGVVKNKKLIGYFIVKENTRIGSKDLVEFLKKKGKEVILISGNGVDSVRNVAIVVGIEKINASLLPTTKAVIINNLRLIGKKVVVVGNSFNDLMAMFSANVSIGLSSRANYLYQEYMDIVIKGENFETIINLFHLHKQLGKSIISNLFWFIVVQSLLVVYFLFATTKEIYPWWWLMIESFATILLVIINSVRLLRLK